MYGHIASTGSEEASLARIRRHNEVHVGWILDRVLEDRMDRNAILCCQLAHSLDDAQIVSAFQKAGNRNTFQNNIGTRLVPTIPTNTPSHFSALQ